MENNCMNIRNLDDGALLIRMKPSEFTECELYHSMITIMEWAGNLHRSRRTEKQGPARKIDPQIVLDALKAKNFFHEHVYNPFQGDYFEGLKR